MDLHRNRVHGLEPRALVGALCAGAAVAFTARAVAWTFADRPVGLGATLYLAPGIVVALVLGYRGRRRAIRRHLRGRALAVATIVVGWLELSIVAAVLTQTVREFCLFRACTPTPAFSYGVGVGVAGFIAVLHGMAAHERHERARRHEPETEP